jgi:hypothetical protein
VPNHLARALTIFGIVTAFMPNAPPALISETYQDTRLMPNACQQPADAAWEAVLALLARQRLCNTLPKPTPTVAGPYRHCHADP